MTQCQEAQLPDLQASQLSQLSRPPNIKCDGNQHKVTNAIAYVSDVAILYDENGARERKKKFGTSMPNGFWTPAK